jgi:hypothetical protein
MKKKDILVEREKTIIESFYKTFNKIKRVDEDFDYASAEKEFTDKGYYEHDMKVEELGNKTEEALQGLRGKWGLKKVKDHFIVTNADVPNKEMEIGLSVDRPEYKDAEYQYYYILRGVNKDINPMSSGHQGNYTIEKNRFNEPSHLFISGKHPFELWFT